MKTPTEVQADMIADLEAKLQLADERIFFLVGENAALRTAVDYWKAEWNKQTKELDLAKEEKP